MESILIEKWFKDNKFDWQLEYYLPVTEVANCLQIINLLYLNSLECVNYGTDVTIEILKIYENVTQQIPFINYIGFRDMGVDHTDFIECRLSSPVLYGDFSNIYTNIYKVFFDGNRISMFVARKVDENESI